MASPTTFHRLTITTQDAGGVVVDRMGYRLHGSPWAAVRREGAASKRLAWAVHHVPTGLLVHAELEDMQSAKALCVVLHEAHPALPALDLLPFGKAPSTEETPEAKAEALLVFATLQAWIQQQRGS